MNLIVQLARIEYRERFVAQLPSLFRQWITTKKTFLDAMQERDQVIVIGVNSSCMDFMSLSKSAFRSLFSPEIFSR